jgi:hypothetical protein
LRKAGAFLNHSCPALDQKELVMPIDIKDTDNGLGIIFSGSRIITENEYLDIYKKHLTQDRDKFQKYAYSLNDWTAVAEVEVSSGAIAQIADLCKNAATINPDLVVTHSSNQAITYGLSRMWEILADETKWEIMVFRNREDAEDWIRQKVKEKHGISNLTFG